MGSFCCKQPNTILLFVFGFFVVVLLVLFFIVVLGGGTLEYVQRFLQCVKYIIPKFTYSTALFHPPNLIPGTVSTGIIFTFTYMCINHLHHIHPPTSFPATSAPPTSLTPTPVPNPYHPTLTETFLPSCLPIL
jgi:hypothetical protein